MSNEKIKELVKDLRDRKVMKLMGDLPRFADVLEEIDERIAALEDEAMMRRHPGPTPKIKKKRPQ
jgi:hypothetical protein